MFRTVLTQIELLQRLNDDLAQHDVCKDCSFTYIVQLAGYDADGCNWSSANLTCSETQIGSCLPTADTIIRNAKSLFNIRED